MVGEQSRRTSNGSKVDVVGGAEYKIELLLKSLGLCAGRELCDSMNSECEAGVNIFNLRSNWKDRQETDNNYI